jgi:sugar/nucleoside kinase (ribokinase family)
VTVKSVLVVGEVNPDLVLRGDRFPVPGKEVLVEDFVMTLGSASAICAMGLARLGDPVSFVGKVGADPWGAYCVDTMAAAGIDVTRIARNPALKTGVTVSITSSRDRALVSFIGAIGALRAADVADDAFAGAGHLHVSSYFLQEALRPGCRALFARAHAAGLTTSLDPGFDPSERWDGDLRETLAEVDLFFPNEVEVRAITRTDAVPDALRRLAGGRTRTIAKLGAQGCATLADDGRLLQAPSYSVEAVDTTGAGDSFNAGFLHAWLARRPLEECLRWGNACGSLSTRGLGGTARQPSAEEVEQLVRPLA